MNGQLWQECACGNEPVCSDCERCERHCRCTQDEAALKDVDPEKAALRQRIAAHLAHGRRDN